MVNEACSLLIDRVMVRLNYFGGVIKLLIYIFNHYLAPSMVIFRLRVGQFRAHKHEASLLMLPFPTEEDQS